MRGQFQNEPTEVYLKSGKKVRRVIRETAYGNFIIYYGRKLKVVYNCGRYYEVYG